MTLFQVTHYSLPASLATCVSAAPAVPFPGKSLSHIPDTER